METMITLRNEASITKIGPEYQPIVDQVVSVVKSVVQEQLSEIRLLGSVPRGNAIPGNSDIDFLVITDGSLTKDRKRKIKQKAEELSAITSVVSRVDIDVMSWETIGGYPDYELIIKTDSICLHGPDSYTTNEILILNTDLARLWNLDFDSIADAYLTKLVSGEMDQEEIKRYSRLTGKDLMKCFRSRLILDFGVCDRRIDCLWESLRRYLPEHSAIFDALWELYRYPTDDKDLVVHVIDEAKSRKSHILGVG